MAITSKQTLMIGRIVSGIVVVALLADAAVMLLAPDKMSGAMNHTGFPTGLAAVIGGILLGATVLYAIPQTAVLGAILITGFLGGAICTHVRIGEMGSPPQIACLVLGVLTWGGLYLRDARVRGLLPVVSAR